MPMSPKNKDFERVSDTVHPIYALRWENMAIIGWYLSMLFSGLYLLAFGDRANPPEIPIGLWLPLFVVLWLWMIVVFVIVTRDIMARDYFSVIQKTCWIAAMFVCPWLIIPIYWAIRRNKQRTNNGILEL